MNDNQYWRVLDCVLRLEVCKGHHRWTMSELSRLSGVSRTLIYYYFGKSKPKIVQAAVKVLGDEFFGLKPERMKLWQEGRIRDSIMMTRELIKKAPHMPEFYFHWRHQTSEVGTELLEIESKYLDKLRRLRPELSVVQRRALFAVFFGLALAPTADPDSIDLVITAAFAS